MRAGSELGIQSVASAAPASVVTDVLEETVARFAQLQPFDGYVDPERILVVGARGQNGPYGRRAACHFTRFRDTRERVSACGRFELPEIRAGAADVRYVISFTFPRYLKLTQREQAEDVVHELLHIDPSFDGAASPLRHGKRYEAAVKALVDEAERQGIVVPELAPAGATILYRRFRPFPKAYWRDDPEARRMFFREEQELAALAL